MTLDDEVLAEIRTAGRRGATADWLWIKVSGSQAAVQSACARLLRAGSVRIDGGRYIAGAHEESQVGETEPAESPEGEEPRVSGGGDVAVTKKACKRCGKEKPLDEFHKHPEGKYGRDPNCKDCKREIAKAKYQVKLQGSASPRKPKSGPGSLAPAPAPRAPKSTGELSLPAATGITCRRTEGGLCIEASDGEAISIAKHQMEEIIGWWRAQ